MTEAISSEYPDHDHQKKLAGKRSQSELVRAQVQNRWLIGALFVSLLIAVIAVYSAYVSNERYANNVRVAWVKLFPDGTHKTEFLEDGGASDRWFDAAVNSSLMNYAEARFKKQKATIKADYGFAQYFLGDAALTQFMQEFNAPKVAAEFLACYTCNQVSIDVRAIDHSTYLEPDAATDAVFRSTVYITETERTPEGQIASRKNKLIPLVWRLRPIDELTESPDLLKANPLGIEILEQSVRMDLTAAGGNK